MAPEPLTPARRAVLDAIRDYIRANGYPPSVREIADSLGRASYAGVNEELQRLQDGGWIRRDPRVSRGIVLLDPDKPEETK